MSSTIAFRFRRPLLAAALVTLVASTAAIASEDDAKAGKAKGHAEQGQGHDDGHGHAGDPGHQADDAPGKAKGHDKKDDAGGGSTRAWESSGEGVKEVSPAGK